MSVEIKEYYNPNSPLKLRVARGHFATSHSHINYFIDVSTQKTRLSEAQAVARELVSYYNTNTIVDTVLCLDGTQVIGTCLAADVTQILTSIVTVSGSLFMMIRISPPLSAVMLVTIPAAVIYTARMRTITQPRFAIRSKNYGIMNGYVEEMMSGQKKQEEPSPVSFNEHN